VSRRLSVAATAAVVLILVTACGHDEHPGPSGPERTALRLFEPAFLERPDEQRLEALFGSGLDGRKRASLLDALAAMPLSPAVEAVGSEKLEDLDRVVVDIVTQLPAGGSARYSVQLGMTAGGGWRRLWFQGPGVEWPPPGRARGDGLTTSAPPAGDESR
jgi:hypothetical protein